MRLAPLLQASPAIQIHVAAALIAIFLGFYQFLGRKGSMPHRLIGWIWVILLASICISSFFIPGSVFIGPISVFHALSVYTLWSLVMGVKAARDHEVADHKSYMTWIFGLSILLSAVIAVGSSGGVLHEMFFTRR
ncbi:MAG: DUF2306 domain-containing protein [Beijerinckiaceae bacterium]